MLPGPIMPEPVIYLDNKKVYPAAIGVLYEFVLWVVFCLYPYFIQVMCFILLGFNQHVERTKKYVYPVLSGLNQQYIWVLKMSIRLLSVFYMNFYCGLYSAFIRISYR